MAPSATNPVCASNRARWTHNVPRAKVVSTAAAKRRKLANSLARNRCPASTVSAYGTASRALSVRPTMPAEIRTARSLTVSSIRIVPRGPPVCRAIVSPPSAERTPSALMKRSAAWVLARRLALASVFAMSIAQATTIV
jgi:hypothetical protein